MQAPTTKVKTLVLDAGPLLSLTPLRGLAERYVTVPQVLDELKDKRAREHFERLALTAGVQVEVRKPDAAALMKVTTFAKKTGDYAVLSHADLCVLALTCALDEEAKTHEQEHQEATQPLPPIAALSNGEPSVASLTDPTEDLVDALDTVHIDRENGQLPSVAAAQEHDTGDPVPAPDTSSSDSDREPTPLFEDPSSEEDDGEGEWITPSNVALHKSRALELLPDDEAPNPSKTGRGKERASATINEPQSVAAGCMTADFAMQNVLLQMGLNLIGIEGKRINRVKTWVLRCHACFKICKDPAKKFCPSCGNATLLRTSVTVISSSSSPDAEPKLQVHLKKNFQWRNRGTKYSIPAPKAGSSKTGGGEGLILREDQAEWIRAEKRAEGRRLKEEKKMVNTLGAGTGSGVKLDWMDPDWLPEMLVVGAGGKGRSTGRGDMPAVGHGRKNPNERKRRKK
ncbi:hypothetical protein K439DRAFT_1415242 [Ramaria rubella]|nr:hypothetical protein K439DRAFT_1415242 [Ramaria rubella]